ncbi:MAG: hypothetical protein KME15_24370 [Drouetiella hepatica Uher 2000/2452]|uniref:Uncharacterized protein n=1 Tax=Drouetiella hepatica Uher 2000/2452 TaxID=904376 RepID=A0A951QH95_9CYAN|nr:hypothetical protein [Drouetiella hepatica Uher 2000/2452]
MAHYLLTSSSVPTLDLERSPVHLRKSNSYLNRALSLDIAIASGFLSLFHTMRSSPDRLTTKRS